MNYQLSINNEHSSLTKSKKSKAYSLIALNMTWWWALLHMYITLQNSNNHTKLLTWTVRKSLTVANKTSVALPDRFPWHKNLLYFKTYQKIAEILSLLDRHIFQITYNMYKHMNNVYGSYWFLRWPQFTQYFGRKGRPLYDAKYDWTKSPISLERDFRIQWNTIYGMALAQEDWGQLI